MLLISIILSTNKADLSNSIINPDRGCSWLDNMGNYKSRHLYLSNHYYGQKYLKIFKGNPRNITHWLFILVYGVIFGLFDGISILGSAYSFVFIGGLLLLHFSLNYYFYFIKDKNQGNLK
jgi:hypothetical protein